MIAFALVLALAQDGSGSGASIEAKPADPVAAEPVEPADGAITNEQPTTLTLAPKPSPIRRVKPSGPTTSKYFATGGVTCQATIAVDNQGKATGVTMVSGVETCPEPFQKACLRTMKYWKFLPANQDGRAIAASYDAKVTFHEDGSVDGADAK
jgi:hypothetical protein